MSEKETILNTFNTSYVKILHSLPLTLASVLIPLVEKDGKLYVLFEVRSDSIEQGSEICFPGGHMEEGESPVEVAIRETCEELLINKNQIHDPRLLYRSDEHGDLDLFCCMAFLEDYKGTYSKDEVEHVFMLPIGELLEMKPEESVIGMKPDFKDDFPFDLIPDGRNYPWRLKKKRFWFYKTEKGIIWGMTAELLHAFLEEIKEG